jgi:hypothetical protein
VGLAPSSASRSQVALSALLSAKALRSTRSASLIPLCPLLASLSCSLASLLLWPCPTPRSALPAVRLLTFEPGVASCPAGEASRVPYERHPHMHRVRDSGEPVCYSRLTQPTVLPSRSPNAVSIPIGTAIDKRRLQPSMRHCVVRMILTGSRHHYIDIGRHRAGPDSSAASSRAR